MDNETRAMGLYTLAACGPRELFKLLPDEPYEVLDLLYAMLTAENPDMCEEDRELNAQVAPFVKVHLDRKTTAPPQMALGGPDT